MNIRGWTKALLLVGALLVLWRVFAPIIQDALLDAAEATGPVLVSQSAKKGKVKP